jgi:hypothetical protein
MTIWIVRHEEWPSQRSAAHSSGCGDTLPCFPRFLKKRNGAPGGARGLRGPSWVPGALLRDTLRALQGWVCETHPEARAGGDLKACEASPPNRCASRRSTGRLRFSASGPGCGWPDLRPRCPARPLGPRRLMRAARPASSDATKIRPDSEAGITYFRPQFPPKSATRPGCGKYATCDRKRSFLPGIPCESR